MRERKEREKGGRTRCNKWRARDDRACDLIFSPSEIFFFFFLLVSVFGRSVTRVT